jgi:hypothetical protein
LTALPPPTASDEKARDNLAAIRTLKQIEAGTGTGR